MEISASYNRDLFEGKGPRADGEPLRRYLSETSRCRVDLTLTQNRVSMISLVFVRDGYVRIRLHEQFLKAPAAVLSALAAYLRTRHPSVWTEVAAYAREISVPAAAPSVRPVRRLSTQGKVYDLREIADAVNTQFFNGRIHCQIGWGMRRARSRRRGRTRSIRYGSWSLSTRTIRIHPLLDDIRVSRDFVAYIVFHEMLHVVVPSERRSGRRIDHGSVFRNLEQLYPNIKEMKKIATRLLSTLLG